MSKDVELVVKDFIALYDSYNTVSDEMIESLREAVYGKAKSVLDINYQEDDYVSVSHLAHMADIPFQDAAEALQIMTNTQHNDF
jgi:hypothetical protein